ncbi:hypothetical protein MBOE_46780 [Mycolicibacterium boenickei]|uniref:Uncharacterized protein n=1 Tax=Mycolicibacterium boenickei TaxID=146017 RepID=A0ABN5ZJI5_9MYCO|nr:hypothetical protein MBOE_46780 [Mycolicibacterium boenickei]
MPDSEFNDPTLIFGPEVSTQEAAFAASVSLARLPQPARSRLVAAIKLPAASADRRNGARPGTRIGDLSLELQRFSADRCQRRCKRLNALCGRRIGTLERRCYWEMSVCDKQINLKLDRVGLPLARRRDTHSSHL